GRWRERKWRPNEFAGRRSENAGSGTRTQSETTHLRGRCRCKRRRPWGDRRSAGEIRRRPGVRYIAFRRGNYWPFGRHGNGGAQARPRDPVPEICRSCHRTDQRLWNDTVADPFEVFCAGRCPNSRRLWKEAGRSVAFCLWRSDLCAYDRLAHRVSLEHRRCRRPAALSAARRGPDLFLRAPRTTRYRPIARQLSRGRIHTALRIGARAPGRKRRHDRYLGLDGRSSVPGGRRPRRRNYRSPNHRSLGQRGRAPLGPKNEPCLCASRRRVDLGFWSGDCGLDRPEFLPISRCAGRAHGRSGLPDPLQYHADGCGRPDGRGHSRGDGNTASLLTLADIPFRWGRSSPLRTLAAGLLAIAAFLELLAWAKFPFGGYDSFSHIYWIAEWHRLWACGIPYPRWLPDSFHGFGAPSFYYYPPFPFFLSSLLYTVLPSFTAADIGKLLGLFAFLFSFFSMRSYLGWRANTMHAPMKSSIVTAAALLYTFGPYRIFNYATRGALPEHLAFGFVPLAFWGIDLLVQDKKRSGFLLLIVSLSFLILTDLPATAVAGIGMFLYVVFQQGQQRVNGLKGLFIAAVAAVLLTSFYLLPVGEMFGLVQMGRLWRVVPLVQSTPFLAIFTGEALTINSYSFIMLV